ncbi:GNAT family N-acetyltransferase [Pontibacter ruber]|uniref:GNAT family N-acetyltransferase n=1 Tax=Pontibacter ruber TaxID=1343895 RepID=A0ABW5D0Z3_9BACT|nr:GNAT family N-acetyltransferase [Pontibacter ruber]
MQIDKGFKTSVLAPKAAEVEILVGDDVFKLLTEERFLSKWDVLSANCTWGTVFQSREFVSTWYRVYQHAYLPILIKAEKEDKLEGLLTMAVACSDSQRQNLDKLKGRIVGAGQFDAEYQTWLAEATNGEKFIKDALEKISSLFPLCNIVLRYLPPDVPLDWISTDNRWRKKAVIQAYRRPLMEMGHPDLPKFFRKTEFRNKLNRLKKLGDLKFERITHIGVFSSILQGLTIQYDFRQGAMFNKNQFRDSPEKSELLLALFEQNLLHVTTLKVNEEILACIVAVSGRGWVHLGGINIHTPFYANYYSPGFVHFLMLGQQLAHEGIDVFDLTPGGDSYKERLATGHDYVYELVIANSQVFNLKRKLRKTIQEQLIKAGKRPMSVELSLKKKLYLLKGRLKDIKQHKVSAILDLVSKEKLKFYRLDLTSSLLESPLQVHKDNLSDLLNYEQRGSLQTRWEFLEEAMHRFEVGEHCYSWSEQGQLLGCAWVGAADQEAQRVHLSQLPEGVALVQGIYCHPAAYDRLLSFLAAVVKEALGEPNAPAIVISVKDAALCKVIEASGIKSLS